MPFKRIISSALISGLLLVSIPAGVSAVPKVAAGKTCKTFKQRTTFQGQSFTCIKSGKKLVWSKDALVKKTSSDQVPNQPSQPAPSPSPSVAQEAVPTSFSDLYEKRSGIAFSIWSKFQANLKKSEVTLPEIDYYRGPSTGIYVQDPAFDFKLVAQLFPNIKLPKKFVVFYWSSKDKDTVAAKALSIMGAENEQKNVNETTGPFINCNSPTSCEVGHALIGLDGTAYIGIGLPDTLEEAERSGGGKGGVERVEFYHALQLFNYFNNSLQINSQGRNIQSPNLPPTWLNIGGENLVSTALCYRDDLATFKKVSGLKNWTDQVVPNFSPEWISSYLNIENLGKNWSDSGLSTARANILMGEYLMEIFVSIKGPSVLLDFHQQMSKKKSFQETFESLFGTTWETAKPELIKVIYDRYLNNY